MYLAKQESSMAASNFSFFLISQNSHSNLNDIRLYNNIWTALHAPCFRSSSFFLASNEWKNNGQHLTLEGFLLLRSLSPS